jgi:hypothetical protein
VGGETRQVAVVVNVNDLGEITGTDHRVRQHDLAAGHRARVEQVVLRAGRGRKGGDEFLPDRVQWRVGDLREQLREVVEEQPGPVGEGRHRRVVAHRAERLGAGAGHRAQDDPQFLLGVPEQLLPGGQGGVIARRRVGGGWPAGPVGQVTEVQQAGVQPVGVRVLGRELGLDLVVFDDPPRRGVGQEDPARLQAALADHPVGLDVQHAYFTGQNDEPVAGHPVPARSQSVPVQHRADHRSVGERDQRGAVPGFHHRRVKAVERPQRGVHLLVVLPRLGDHHQHRVRERPAAHVQQFQARVEAGRVARGLVQDRQQPVEAPALGVGPDDVGGQQGFAGPHPVAVAPDRVDLAVVGDEPVRVGQRPGRERVRGEPGVHKGQGRDVPRVGQVGIEPLKLERGQHALVDDRGRRQADEVGARLVLGPLAQAEGPPVEGQAALATARGDEQVGQVRQHVARAGTAVGQVVGHVAPAQDRQAFQRGDPLGRGHGRGALRRVTRQEHHPGRVAAGLRQAERAFGAKQLIRDLRQDAGPVAGVGIAALGAAVIQVPQYGQRLGHDLVTAASGQVRDKAHATGVVLVAAVVKPLGCGESSRCHQNSCRPPSTDPAFGVGTTLALQWSQW